MKHDHDTSKWADAQPGGGPDTAQSKAVAEPAGGMQAASCVLEARNLSKRYGGIYALRSMDLQLRQGEVLGLIGQNGAGKSTLLKLLTGVEQPDEGSIILRGQTVHLRGVADAGTKGVGIVFQEQSLVPNLTVAENILLGRTSPAVRGGVYRWGQINAEAQRYLDMAGSSARPNAQVDELSFVDRQSVELAKVLALQDRVEGPLVILFDEPTSVLSAAEIEGLFEEIRKLRERAAIVFVSHRMDEVLAISDRVLVLRDGEVVAESDPAHVVAGDLHRLMVGTERAEDYYAQQHRADLRDAPVLLSARGLTHKGKFRDLSFELHAGEILGVAGVVGSGREALCRALFGADPVTSGTVQLAGQALKVSDPADAVEAGIGFIPAERRVEGMVSGRSIAENLVLAATPSLSWAKVVRRPHAEGALVHGWTQQLKVKMPSVATEIQRLSGGNQQKVVLAKWLAVPHLRVLILDHPTRGLDVGAKADVYNAIRAAAGRGIGIVLLSDTLEELMGLSDTVIVMRDGEETGRFNLAEGNTTSEDLIKLMV